MRRNIRLAALAGGILVLSLARSVWKTSSESYQVKPVTPVPAGVFTPAPTPEDDRRIAVLTLRIESDEDEQVRVVELVESMIVRGYGPNVFGLQGPWTVELVSREGEMLQYGILDPRAARVEDLEGEVPHTVMIESKIVTDLVIPLNTAEGKDLNIGEIRLLDQPGNLIFAATISDNEVVPVPLREQ